MRDLNGRRIVLCGLAAGLLMNILHIAAELPMRGETERMIARLSLTAPAESALLVILAGGFLIGIVAVWLYAVLAPLFGARLGTAVLAGVVVWSLNCLLPHMSLLAFGILTPAHAVMAAAADLVTVVAGTLAGASLYRHAPIAATASARAGASVS